MIYVTTMHTILLKEPLKVHIKIRIFSPFLIVFMLLVAFLVGSSSLFKETVSADIPSSINKIKASPKPDAFDRTIPFYYVK